MDFSSSLGTVCCLLKTIRSGINDQDCMTRESLTIYASLYHEADNVISISILMSLGQVTVTKKNCTQAITLHDVTVSRGQASMTNPSKESVLAECRLWTATSIGFTSSSRSSEGWISVVERLASLGTSYSSLSISM